LRSLPYLMYLYKK